MHHRWAIPTALTIFALALRLYQLGAESLWIDEGYSIHSAQSIGVALHTQWARPLYFLFLTLWMHVGRSEFVLRLPSALCGAAAVPALYMLGKRTIGERGGVIASLLMAVSPMQVNHSQEVRMYSMVVLFAILAMRQYLRLMDAPKVRRLLGYLALMGLGIVTFPLSGSLFIAQSLSAFLIIRHRRSRSWLPVQVLALLACVALCIRGVDVIREISVQRAAESYLSRMLGVTGDFSLFSAGPAGTATYWGFWTYTLCAIALIGMGALVAYRRRSIQPWLVAMLVLWLVVPVGITAGLIWVSGAEWQSRYLIYASPAWFLMLGLGASLLPSRRCFSLTVALLLVFPALRLMRYYERPVHPQWRQAVAYVQRAERPGDVIGIIRPGNRHVFEYYYRGSNRWLELGAHEVGRHQQWNADTAARLVRSMGGSHARFWLVISQCERSEVRAVTHYVYAHFRVLRDRRYSQVRTIVFEPMGSALPVGLPAHEKTAPQDRPRGGVVH